MYRAPFQLPLRQGTEIFPSTTQIPSVVHTEVVSDLSSAEHQMTDLLGAAGEAIDQAVGGPSSKPPTDESYYKDAVLSVPPADPQIYLNMAAQLAEAASQLGEDTQRRIDSLPKRAAEHIAQHAPAVSQFILGQRQIAQNGVSPSQRTHLNLPGLSAEYAVLQGAETIYIQVAVPLVPGSTAPRPAPRGRDVDTPDQITLDLIAVVFFDGAS